MNKKFLEEAKLLEKRWTRTPIPFGWTGGSVASMMEASRLPNELPWPPANMQCPVCATSLEDMVYEYQCHSCRPKGVNTGRYRKDDPMTHTVKCLLCEKDLECDKHFVYDGGVAILSFGYGSRYDQGGSGLQVPESPRDRLLCCQEIEAYICDDCFDKKHKLMRGFNVVKKTERTECPPPSL